MCCYPLIYWNNLLVNNLLTVIFNAVRKNSSIQAIHSKSCGCWMCECVCDRFAYNRCAICIFVVRTITTTTTTICLILRQTWHIVILFFVQTDMKLSHVSEVSKVCSITSRTLSGPYLRYDLRSLGAMCVCARMFIANFLSCSFAFVLLSRDNTLYSRRRRRKKNITKHHIMQMRRDKNWNRRRKKYKLILLWINTSMQKLNSILAKKAKKANEYGKCKQYAGVEQSKEK